MDALEARERAAAGGPGQRPLTVTMLAALWMANVLVYLGATVTVFIKLPVLIAAGVAVFCFFMMALSGAMAFGLWKVKGWARMAQLVIAGIGIISCTFTLPSIATLVYMLRPGVASRFATGSGPGDPKEGLFTGLILGTVVLGALLLGGVYALSALGVAGQHFPR
jgi:hypothetical protein